MISPIDPVIFFCGFAMRPRIPASWRACSRLPRAPESVIMKIELKPARSLRSPSNITSPTLEVV